MSVGRGRTICEKQIIMQISPGSSDEAPLIEAFVPIFKAARLTNA
jgi:hypothetical protein